MPQPTQKVSHPSTFQSQQTTILRSFNCSKFVPCIISGPRNIALQLTARQAKQWRLRQDYLSHFSLFRSNQRNRSLSYEDCHQTQSNGSQDEDSLEVILFLLSDFSFLSLRNLPGHSSWRLTQIQNERDSLFSFRSETEIWRETRDFF